MASMYRRVGASAPGGLAAPSALQEMTDTKEASLLATAKSGETAALDTLYRAHAEKLFRTVHRITRNREDAEDAVQDSLLRAFLHLKSFDGRSTFSTWLTRIGINSALMILRKKRNSREISARGPGVDETLWGVPDSAPNPERRCAEREQGRILRDAIRNLRPTIRRALELQILEHRSIEETAAQIGISVSAAKGRVFRAKATLRKSKVLPKINDRHGHRQFSRFSKSGVSGQNFFVSSDKAYFMTGTSYLVDRGKTAA
jgi:RNA polymerase sigma factor (sigma-70 family)